MVEGKKGAPLSQEELRDAVALEAREFEQAYLWLERHMPSRFLEEVEPGMRTLIARHLMSLPLQQFFSTISLKHAAIVLCLDDNEADMRILRQFLLCPLRTYRTFISNGCPPGAPEGSVLRIALLYHYEGRVEAIDKERKNVLFQLIAAKNLSVTEEAINEMIEKLPVRFLRSVPNERLAIAIDMCLKAKEEDACQTSLYRNEEWEKSDAPSVRLVFAWRNAPKAGFLHKIAQIAYAHKLAMRHVLAAYVEPYTTEHIAVVSLGLHGFSGKAAWEEADLDDFIRELSLLPLQVDEEPLEKLPLTGNGRHLIRTVATFVHQVLVHADPNLYSFDNVLEAFLRHPEITSAIVEAFTAKFEPKPCPPRKGEELEEMIIEMIQKLDTGQAGNDLRRKNILRTALNFIRYTCKTNFFVETKSALSFRLDPAYLNEAPFEWREKFPELPYGVFFIRGPHFIGFNIRFKDLARGGVRTITPDRMETYLVERNNIFSEAYNLAYTQQKKNKDIPEGGAKTAILLEPFEVFALEEEVYKCEMRSEGLDGAAQEDKLKRYRSDHRLAYLLASQRMFIRALMHLINCDEAGKLRTPRIIDYWKRPEYIYLGPDENMRNEMILWICAFAVTQGYPPGRSFMTGKPGAGINHKEFGVTSFGVNVYLHEALLAIGVDPAKERFTIKISGGPDGDVAGNELHLLATRYPHTAQLVALTDVSGTIRDPEGLDWEEIERLFREGKPIRHYPADKLHEGGFLLDLMRKQEEGSYSQKTLLHKKQGGKVVQEWLSGNEMNHLFRSNLHAVPATAFVPGGGRPRTLNESNYTSFLSPTGEPTARVIVEGANLYLTPAARRALEKRGVLVLKDSSCNKGGVICSSFEVLAALCLSEEEFLADKARYVQEVLDKIQLAALHEARLLLAVHKETGAFLTDVSEKVSEKINLFKYQVFDHLDPLPFPTDRAHPLIDCLFRYCPPLLREKYPDRVLAIPEIHKKAIVAAFLGARLVYRRGLDWNPSLADVLDEIAKDPHIIED
jgi:glutamate dehydrogenase